MRDRSGRHAQAFWRRFPKDDAWQCVTLAQQESQNFKLEATCRNCFHHGPISTPSETAVWARVPMDAPIIALAARLVCSKCGLPAGYFHGHNPAVRPHR